MKTNEQRQQEARAAQAKFKKQAQDALEKINAKINEYADRANKHGFDWAMAGDMAHLAEQLKDIVEVR